MSEGMIADDINVFGAEFPAICAVHGLELRALIPAEAEISEAFAAQFTIAVLRGSTLLRRRFPRALHGGQTGEFATWLQTEGAARFKLSSAATKKLRGVFRRPPGRHIREIYLQDRELQRLFPLGLTPVGQRHFLGWLTTHGRADQDVQNHEVLWFLHEAAEAVDEGVTLSFLLNPEWQERFPDALTKAGWPEFLGHLQSKYLALHNWAAQLQNPPALREATPVRRSLTSTHGLTGVNILSHFCYSSGIQQATLGTKEALEHAGLATSCRDVPAGIKTTLLPRGDWLGLEVFPITIITVAPTPYFATAYERAGWFRRPGVYRIAYWAWELETIPAEWTRMLPLLDEIWAPTEFVAAAMRSRMAVPVHRMLYPVEVGEIETVTKTELDLPEDHFVFLFMFDMFSDFERKNPLAVVRAFRRAFRPDEKATLVLKTSATSPHAAVAERLEALAKANGITLVRQLLSRKKAYGYLQMCDCYVSLHRSEGFGLGMAEAMLLGKPVIATGYSGNADYMNAGNSFPVDFKRVPVGNAGPIYQAQSMWAAPSEEHAARLMRQVFDHRGEAIALGARAQREMRETLSLRATGERMAARLREINASAR